MFSRVNYQTYRNYREEGPNDTEYGGGLCARRRECFFARSSPLLWTNERSGVLDERTVTGPLRREVCAKVQPTERAIRDHGMAGSVLGGNLINTQQGLREKRERDTKRIA